MVAKIKNKRRRALNPEYKRDGSNGPRMLKRSGVRWVSQEATIGGSLNLTYTEARRREALAQRKREFDKKWGSATVAQLREEAARLHVKGRSSMNRAELSLSLESLYVNESPLSS